MVLARRTHLTFCESGSSSRSKKTHFDSRGSAAQSAASLLQLLTHLFTSVRICCSTHRVSLQEECFCICLLSASSRTFLSMKGWEHVTTTDLVEVQQKELAFASVGCIAITDQLTVCSGFRGEISLCHQSAHSLQICRTSAAHVYTKNNS